MTSVDMLYVGVGVAAAVVAITAFIFLRPKKETDGESKATGPVGLDQREYRKFPLIEKRQISPNTFFFRFQLPTPNTRLGLPVGKHMLLRFMDKETPVARAYTPISSDDDLGHFDLVIKLYEKGLMSQHLNKLEANKDFIESRGPLGALSYLGKGQFEIKRKNPQTGEPELYKRNARTIGMLAGGTGVTPMFQIISDIVKRKENVRTSMIFGNITEQDILLRDELKKVTAEHQNIAVYCTLDKPSDDWTQGRGFITKDMIKAHLPPPGDNMIILLCGPPPMVGAMEKNLTEMGYTEDMYFKY